MIDDGGSLRVGVALQLGNGMGPSQSLLQAHDLSSEVVALTFNAALARSASTPFDQIPQGRKIGLDLLQSRDASPPPPVVAAVLCEKSLEAVLVHSPTEPRAAGLS